MRLVRFFIRAIIACWMCISVRVSTLEVASSRMRIFGSRQHGAGNGEKLALPAAQISARFAEQGVVARGELFDEGVRIGGARRRRTSSMEASSRP